MAYDSSGFPIQLAGMPTSGVVVSETHVPLWKIGK